jgi:hypothetical protein
MNLPDRPVNLITEQDLSRYTKISVPCLKHWRSIGYGPSYLKYKGRIVRYDLLEVLRWVDSCVVEPGEEPGDGMRLVGGVYEIVVYGGR